MEGAEAEEYEPGKLFVGGLSWNTTEERMKAYFEQFGVVSDCVVMKDPSQAPNVKRNRGFGFVTFEDPAAVDRVLCPGATHTLDDKTIDPKKAQKKSGVKDTDKKVFIGGLASTTTVEQVKEYFNTHYGGVVEVVFKYDATNSTRKRGFGFVVFQSTDYVTKVLQMQFHEIDGKKVEVKKAEPRSATASAMRLTAPAMGYYHAPYGGPGDYSAANGHYGGQWGHPNQQYYNTSYPPPPPPHHPGYGPQYNTGGSYQYDHSGYGRTQTSAGDRSADPHQSYYHAQHTYGQQQTGAAGGGAGGYGQENGGYPQHQGRGGYSGAHGGYGQPHAAYGRGGMPQQQQQQRYGAGGYSH